MKATLFHAAVAASSLPSALSSPFAASSDLEMVYDFSALTASPELSWTPCYDNFTCALLEVPLDYANVSTGTLNIAIIKKPGSSEDAQEVLVNPGGPGGSSVAMVLLDFQNIQNKIGTDYALVGIDPRGVNNSGPVSDCFPGYPFQSRNAFLSDAFAPPDVTSDYVLRQSHQSTLAYGKWCTSIYSVNGTAKYASTVATAQDMLHYIQLRAHDLGQPPEEAQLWYYGISYGSILGPTFASLYPTRIGRMIIDGVLDLQDYYNGGWETSIDSSDEAARYFFKRCFEAGPSLCSFHQNASSWEDLEQRYQNILAALKHSPIGLGDPTSETSMALAATGAIVTPFVSTWVDLVSALFTVSYLLTPTHYISFDVALTSLEAGDTEVLSVATDRSQISTFRPGYDDRMARALISCLDANGRSNYTDFTDFRGFVNVLYNESSYGGLNVAAMSGPICSALDVKSPESQIFDGIPKSNTTSTPILFISSIVDPVTPLSAAERMHSIFSDSGLLVFNNSGHTAHFQNVTCVSEYEKQYMRSGKLPPEGMVCEVDEANPWVTIVSQMNVTQTGADAGVAVGL